MVRVQLNRIQCAGNDAITSHFLLKWMKFLAADETADFLHELTHVTFDSKSKNCSSSSLH